MRRWLIRFGGQFQIDANARVGMTPDDARRSALAASGGLPQTVEAYRDRQSFSFVETTMLDLQYAFRMLRKTPGFSAVAIATLALGIGANTAIFSVINAVLIEALPFKDPSRLVVLWEEQARRPEIDSQQPIAGVRTLDAIVQANLGDRRQQMVLLGLFAGLAVLLASIGLYGVLSYSVAQRTREFGVRMALGATRTSVLTLVLSRGVLLNGAGLAIGAAVAWAGTRTMSSLLYGVTAGDPLTFAAVLLLLALVGLVACLIPARRATRIEAMEALRSE